MSAAERGESAIPTIYPDEQTMRRRKHHYILDERGDLMWTGAKMGSCLEWLYENGHAEFYLQLEAGKFRLTIVRCAD